MINLAMMDIRAAANQAELHKATGTLPERPASAGESPVQAARDITAREYRRHRASVEAGLTALGSIMMRCPGKIASTEGTPSLAWLNPHISPAPGTNCGTPEKTWDGVEAAINAAYRQTQ